MDTEAKEPTAGDAPRDPYLWKLIASCASVNTRTLPWAYLDGATYSHSQLELIIC